MEVGSVSVFNVYYSTVYISFAFCRDLNHKNLVKLIGVSVGKPIFIVTEFCGKVSAKFIFLIMWF